VRHRVYAGYTLKSDKNLLDVTSHADLTDIKSIANLPARYGPVMIGGNFGAMINLPVVQRAYGRVFGHFIVIAGTGDDPQTDQFWIQVKCRFES
jgi:hypothetical protein